VAKTRRVLVSDLDSRGVGSETVGEAEIVVSELIANALRHAGMDPAADRIVFFGRMQPNLVRIEVGDNGPGFDPAQQSEVGFGLRLLDKLASRWGCERSGQGFRVWFEVDQRRRRFGR